VGYGKWETPDEASGATTLLLPRFWFLGAQRIGKQRPFLKRSFGGNTTQNENGAEKKDYGSTRFGDNSDESTGNLG